MFEKLAIDENELLLIYLPSWIGFFRTRFYINNNYNLQNNKKGLYNFD